MTFIAYCVGLFLAIVAALVFLESRIWSDGPDHDHPLVTIEEIGPPQNGVHPQDYYGPILEQLALDDNGGDGSSALRKLKGFS